MTHEMRTFLNLLDNYNYAYNELHELLMKSKLPTSLITTACDEGYLTKESTIHYRKTTKAIEHITPKTIQIIADSHGDVIYALRSDGSIWVGSNDTWTRLPDIPGDN